MKMIQYIDVIELACPVRTGKIFSSVFFGRVLLSIVIMAVTRFS